MVWGAHSAPGGSDFLGKNSTGGTTWTSHFQDYTISFGVTFSSAPIVVVTPISEDAVGNYSYVCHIYDNNTTTCSVRVHRIKHTGDGTNVTAAAGSSPTVALYWMARGTID